jgi:hypothetical protein
LWPAVSPLYAISEPADHREAISAAVDLYLAVYPAVILYGLRINLKTKLALSVALGLGSM